MRANVGDNQSRMALANQPVADFDCLGKIISIHIFLNNSKAAIDRNNRARYILGGITP